MPLAVTIPASRLADYQSVIAKRRSKARGAFLKPMKKPKQKMGRPWPKDHIKNVSVIVSLPPDLDAKAIRLGNGKRSRGIQIALVAMKENGTSESS